MLIRIGFALWCFATPQKTESSGRRLGGELDHALHSLSRRRPSRLAEGWLTSSKLLPQILTRLPTRLSFDSGLQFSRTCTRLVAREFRSPRRDSARQACARAPAVVALQGVFAYQSPSTPEEPCSGHSSDRLSSERSSLCKADVLISFTVSKGATLPYRTKAVRPAIMPECCIPIMAAQCRTIDAYLVRFPAAQSQRHRLHGVRIHCRRSTKRRSRFF